MRTLRITDALTRKSSPSLEEARRRWGAAEVLAGSSPPNPPAPAAPAIAMPLREAA
jgi:hypothetical protein